MNVIDIQNLTKYYGKKSRGIENLTMSVAEGEIFGFIGPNGAGKSTTIRTLLNFIYPTEGKATIFGKDIVKDSKEIRAQVGYLPSEVHYYDDMKAKDLLKYSAGFHGGNFDNNMKDLADRLSLDLNRKIEDLSFGNKKKVGIIQALLHEPKLLILDEPTSGLDPLMQNIFFDLLLEKKKDGATIFFSSHNLGEVQKLCDRVGIIKAGQLIKVERIEELRKNQFKRITIEFDGEPNTDLDMEGIIQKEVFGNSIKFLYSGNTRTLIQHLTDVTFRDLLIEEPSLEEVFIHYYEN